MKGAAGYHFKVCPETPAHVILALDRNVEFDGMYWLSTITYGL